MNINLNEETIQKALDEQTTKAVESAFKDYAIEQAIRDRITKCLIDDIISDALAKSVDMVDVNALAKGLAEQIAKTSVSAAHHLLLENTVATIAHLRGIESYQNDFSEKMDRLRAELKSHEK